MSPTESLTDDIFSPGFTRRVEESKVVLPVLAQFPAIKPGWQWNAPKRTTVAGALI
jgi:hypothetical protein